MFGFIADALYFAVDSMYMNMYEDLLTYWDTRVPSFNHGQLSIYLHNMEPEVYAWLDESQDQWPYADADAYMSYLFTCYNGEVMERAFSDSIMEPVDQLWETIYAAQELYELAQMFEALSFG